MDSSELKSIFFWSWESAESSSQSIAGSVTQFVKVFLALSRKFGLELLWTIEDWDGLVGIKLESVGEVGWLENLQIGFGDCVGGCMAMTPPASGRLAPKHCGHLQRSVISRRPLRGC